MLSEAELIELQKSFENLTRSQLNLDTNCDCDCGCACECECHTIVTYDKIKIYENFEQQLMNFMEEYRKCCLKTD